MNKLYFLLPVVLILGSGCALQPVSDGDNSSPSPSGTVEQLTPSKPDKTSNCGNWIPVTVNNITYYVQDMCPPPPNPNDMPDPATLAKDPSKMVEGQNQVQKIAPGQDLNRE